MEKTLLEIVIFWIGFNTLLLLFCYAAIKASNSSWPLSLDHKR
jgi:hypothetical protein